MAAVAKGGQFSKDESLAAKAELSGRMDKLLAPFSSSPRAVSMAIKAIYPALGADVREALGWTEGMLKTGDAIIRNFGPPENELETGSIFDKLLKFQATPGVLKFDQSLIERRGVSINLTA